MLFNSGLFLQFFAAFLLLYYAVRNRLAARNWLIVIASYIFYAAWDWRFLSLLVISSLLDFYVGQGLQRVQSAAKRKFLISLSLSANLGLLGFFKYYDFFVESFIDLFVRFGIQLEARTLGVVLPVGISFYTFQTISYAIDVYRRQIPAADKLVNFLAYVAFFPQLVAGPIERASHLLPQFAETRIITLAMIREGIWLCIWGMFKKVVIADSMAPLVEMVYTHPNPTAPLVLLATFAFGLQIYGDFSGYSDIARGTARILGFDIMLNFNLPYLAGNIRGFWSRWHISLSTWLRDYLYIPLGGNRRGPLRNLVNLSITMALGGLWHGAKWNFVLWGAWHGIALIAHRIWRMRRGNQIESRWSAAGWLLTILAVFYGWMLFRADSFAHIVTLHRAFANWSAPGWFGSYCLNLAVFSLPLILMQAWQFRRKNLLAPLGLQVWVVGLLQGALLIAIIVFWGKEKVPFIYFQF